MAYSVESIKELLNKIEQLRKWYPDSVDHVKFDEWQKALEDAALALDIKDNAIIKRMRERAEEDIKTADGQLVAIKSDVLPDHSRDILIIRREYCKLFLESFLNIEEQADAIKVEIAGAAEHYRQNYDEKASL